MTTPVERAQEILSLPILPDDARKRIKALEKESDEIDKHKFVLIYEGLALRELENLR